MKTLMLLGLLSGLMISPLRAEDTPTTTPAGTVVDATDKDAITANEGKSVTVEGKVDSAKWSKSGKVMNAKFADSPLTVVIFSANKDKIDEQFSGDVAKALNGAKVKIKGKIAPYKGPVEALQGKPQMIITQGSQITIEEAAPSTAPSKS